MASALRSYRLPLFKQLPFLILLLLRRGQLWTTLLSRRRRRELAEEHSAVQAIMMGKGMAGLTAFISSSEVFFDRGRSLAGAGGRVAFERNVISPGFNLPADDMGWRKADEP